MLNKRAVYLNLLLIYALSQPQFCLAASPGQNALDQGTLFYQAADFERAALLFRQATDKDPGLTKAWENLGWAQYKLGNIDEAVRIWNIILKVEPRRVDLLNAVGSTHMEKDRWTESMAAFEESLAIESEQRTIQLRLARGYEALHDWEHAIKLYQNMLRKQPKDVDVIQRLAAVYQQAERTAKAISLLQTHVKELPELAYRLASLYAQQGDTHYHQNQYSAAETLYRKAHLLEPKNPRYLINLGWVYRNQQALKRAMSLWQQALALDATNASLTRHIGDIAFELNDFDTATYWYEEARKRGSISMGSYKHLGWAYWHRQNWKLCEKTWLRYGELYPNDAEPPALLARLYMRITDFDKALQAAEGSLSIQPDQPEIALLRAKALYSGGHYSRARAETVDLVRQYPEHLGINVFMGELLMQYHDFAGGVKLWRRVLQMDPTLEAAQYYWVKSLYETGKQEKALAEARRFLTHSDGNIRLIRLLKDDALNRQDPKTAILWLERELEVAPDTLATWMELAGLYQQIRQYDAARETLELANSVHGNDPMLQLALADLDRAEKDYAMAFKRFSSIARQSPYNRRAYLGRIDSLIGMGRYQAALNLLKKNNPVFLTDDEWQLKQGEILRASNRDDEAMLAYRKVSEPQSNTLNIPALLYHGLTKQERGVNLSAKRFEDQMSALKAAGYTAITLEQLNNMIAGNTAFPQKPIIITFDDARIDSFELGTPALVKHGMRAVMFVPTARIHDGHPFFADWNMIRKYHESGYWDMQNHGHAAHDLIGIDGRGTQGAFLSNFRWLQHEHRVENETEFRKRLDQDYRASTRLLKQKLAGNSILGYSFPFSEAGHELVGTAQNAAIINQQLMARYMPYGFVQDQRGYNRIRIGKTHARVLRRFVVPSHWNGEQLIQHLISKHPIHMAEKKIAKTHYSEGRYGQAREMFIQLASAEQWINSDSIYYLAATEYQRENYHKADRYLANLEETTTQDIPRIKQKTEQLSESLAWRTRPSAGLKFGYFDDANDRTNDWLSARLDFPLKQPLNLWLEPGTIKFRESGLAALRSNEITVGADWQANDNLELDIKLRYRDFNDAKDSVNSWFAVEYWLRDHRLNFAIADRDVDTVSALTADIDTVESRIQYTQTLNKNWHINAKLALQDYSDSNKRYDASIGIDYRLTDHPDWKIGAEAQFSDTDKQSDFYYTPERLFVGQANLYYQHRFKDDLSLNSQLGVGMANDELNGNRLSGQLKLGIRKLWDKRLRGEVDLQRSHVPNYRSTWLQTSLTYLF